MRATAYPRYEVLDHAEMLSVNRSLQGVAILGLALGTCKIGSPPILVDPGDRVAVVGERLTIDLFASDPDGDQLSYDYAVRGLPDLVRTAQMTIAPDGHGVFTFTPLGIHVGRHIFDFSVSDGEYTTLISIQVEIQAETDFGASPIFRQPLSEGTVLDLASNPCVDVDVVVEDPDSATIELSQDPPILLGSTFDVMSSGLTGHWSWCPDRSQVERDRWSVQFRASDGTHTTLKAFLLLMRAPSVDGCSGEAPIIDHIPAPLDGDGGIKISADVSDDVGLKHPPVVLYAFEDPRDEGMLSYDRFAVADTELVLGDRRQGSWIATIPSPTSASTPATGATLYYVIQAVDDDDVAGNCDHLTESPPDGIHVVNIAYSGCEDDDREDDDDPSVATEWAIPDLGPHDAVLCPGDEDWWRLELDEPANVVVRLDGEAPPNIDLTLVDAQEQVLDESRDSLSTELVEATCLASGRYSIGVTMTESGVARGNYRLELELDPAPCRATNACCTATTGTGCSSALELERCVCEIDDFCCLTAWDSTCAAISMSACGAICPSEPQNGGCCEVHQFPGCEYPAVQSCACEWDLSCCNPTTWTQRCVTAVEQFCGGCES